MRDLRLRDAMTYNVDLLNTSNYNIVNRVQLVVKGKLQMLICHEKYIYCFNIILNFLKFFFSITTTSLYIIILDFCGVKFNLGKNNQLLFLFFFFFSFNNNCRTPQETDHTALPKFCKKQKWLCIGAQLFFSWYWHQLLLGGRAFVSSLQQQLFEWHVRAHRLFLDNPRHCKSHLHCQARIGKRIKHFDLKDQRWVCWLSSTVSLVQEETVVPGRRTFLFWFKCLVWDPPI